MSDSTTSLDEGLGLDSKVAAFLDTHPKTLPRWDRNPKLRALGWPDPIYIGGRKFRPWAAVKEFVRRAAVAHAAINPNLK
jgi:hypothetical protein